MISSARGSFFQEVEWKVNLKKCFEGRGQLSAQLPKCPSVRLPSRLLTGPNNAKSICRITVAIIFHVSNRQPFVNPDDKKKDWSFFSVFSYPEMAIYSTENVSITLSETFYYTWVNLIFPVLIFKHMSMNDFRIKFLKTFGELKFN